MTKRTQIEKIHKTPAAGSLTLGDRVYLKFGWPMVKSLHVLATVLLFGLVLFVDYLLVLFTAVNVLPNIAALVQKGTGMTVDMRIDAVIAGWLIPVLFIVAAVLVGEIVLMRRLWRFASGRLDALAGSLFRLEDEKRSGQRPVTLIPTKAQASRRPKFAALS
ncbi:hypothetical protein [Arthrobacter sp. ES1]|uniref:hypothetical protein n=1 Tax=Arthrobacter sp. ES1 TaxID=1897056 RepID=UPI001CFFF67C|nr:hypothetical protein [Arthrobacter sp. ES1]MCB5280371.1 hypothetical protein [Arthrobacter sp. ES1]